MTLRAQLLLVSLLVLVLPWSGCQYVREMETALRRGQEDALLGTARAVASVLQNRPKLLARTPEASAAADRDQPIIYAHSLPGPIQIDGYVDDWALAPGAFLPLGDDRARFVAGRHGRYLHFFVSVDDDRVLYATGTEARATDSDRLYLDFLTPQGSTRSLLFSTAAPGPILARVDSPDAPGELPREQRALANWQETDSGFNLELRLPLDVVGSRLGLRLLDVDPGKNDPQMRRLSGRLLHELRPLDELLEEFAQPGLALRVTDRHGWILGTAEASGRAMAAADRRESMLDRIYSAILHTRAPPGPTVETPGRIRGAHVAAALDGERGAAWHRAGEGELAIISVAQPVREGNRVIGTVVLEQGSERILTLTNHALTRLLNLTLLATLLAATGLLAYATWLSLRIRRLRDAAESATGSESRDQRRIPGTGAPDEIGDLARSFSGMLGRLDEYTRYLRSLASRLSHELRTPLAVVSTSLENLEHEALPDEARPLAERARQGTRRLSRIVTAMSAATHVEQSIEMSERKDFDLCELIRASAAAYRQVFPDRRFIARLPEEPCPLHGAPDLLSQMLDKLVDNAVDFSMPGAAVELDLSRDRDGYRLSVFNPGAALPEKMQSQLFDSLVSVRERGGEAPHLGLGLHIARLIVEHHRGTITARNSTPRSGAGPGVELEVWLPLRKIPDSITA